MLCFGRSNSLFDAGHIVTWLLCLHQAFSLILSLSRSVYVSGHVCQDIDHDACITMATQNANMCSDPILRTSACPRYCNNCPITCYNCTVSSPDVSMCKLVTCQNNQACMVKEINPLLGGMHTYTLGCEQKTVCDGAKKRSIQSRSVHIDCCLTDLCNTISAPTTDIPTTDIPTTKQSLTTTQKSLLHDGYWSKWTIWGPCISGSDSNTWYQERSRECNNQHNDTSSASCINGSTEYHRAPCTTCAPPLSVKITSNGTWKIGGVVYLRCVTTGYPKPSIDWMKMSSNIIPAQLAGNDSLMIGPITKFHPDLFKCGASNSCGTMESEVFTTPSASSSIVG